MNILLIDDHPLFTISLKKILEESNDVNNIFILNNANNIYNIIENNEISIILLDIHLGKENGFTIAKKLKRVYPQIPLAFLTGFDFINYKSIAVEIGVEGFLSKTISPVDLLKKIKEIVEKPQPLNDIEVKDKNILTKREVQILNYLADGLKQAEIAEYIGLSRRTVQSVIYHIYEKLNVNTLGSAIKKGIELGVISISLE